MGAQAVQLTVGFQPSPHFPSTGAQRAGAEIQFPELLSLLVTWR